MEKLPVPACSVPIIRKLRAAYQVVKAYHSTRETEARKLCPENLDDSDKIWNLRLGHSISKLQISV